MNKLKSLSLLLLLSSPLLCMQDDGAGAGGYEGDGTDHIGKTKTIFGSKKIKTTRLKLVNLNFPKYRIDHYI